MGGDDLDPDLVDLCRREHVRLVGLLALYTGDRPVAEDLAQEALLRLHDRWDQVRAMPSPRAWLSAVAINLARSWWRRRYAEQRAYRRHGAAPVSEPAAEPADVLAVRRAVAALPLRQRAALVLRYYGGLSLGETAAALRCADGTVKSLTHKAIARLRADLDDAEREEIPHA